MGPSSLPHHGFPEPPASPSLPVVFPGNVSGGLFPAPSRDQEPEVCKQERTWKVTRYWGSLSLPAEDTQETNTKYDGDSHVSFLGRLVLG